MATSLDDLITPETEDESLEYFLTEAANVGFPTTAWQTGGVAYTIIRILAKKTVDFVTLLAAIAKGGLLDLSTGLWLTLLAANVFRLTRYAATFATGNVRLTIATGFSNQTIQPGQIWIKTTSGYRYNSVNPSPVTITAGSSQVVPFKAEQKGSKYNVALGTGLTLVTPLPGLTAAFENVGDGTPWTVQGSDEESDAALRLRCVTKWALLGNNKPSDAYRHLATNTPGLGTQPNRVNVDDLNPRGPNTLNIWLAGPSGPLPSADVALINTYIQARKSPCADVQVAAAVSKLVTVSATMYRSGSFSSAKALAVDNLTAYLQSLPIGGKALLSQCIEEIMSPDGVADCSIPLVNSVQTDLQLLPNEVATVSAITLVDTVQN